MPSPPAKPVLASALLAQEEQTRLKHQWQWRTGVSSIDASLPPNLWTSGKVIGIVDHGQPTTSSASHDIEPLNTSSKGSSSSEQGRSRSALITHLLVTHLASLHQTISTSMNTTTTTTLPNPTLPATAAVKSKAPPPISIITSPMSLPSAPLSPTSLATALQHHTPTSQPGQPLPLTLLSSVSLLQYLDFPGLVDALAEVSHSLLTTTTTTETNVENTAEVAADPSILVVDGLLPTLRGLLRKSGLVKTNALLVPLLRELKSFSCVRREALVLILLQDEEGEEILGRGGGGVRSAFSFDGGSREGMGEAGTGRDPVRGNGGGGGREKIEGRRSESGTGLMGSIMNVLVSGIDTLVLIHTMPDDDGRVKEVVEVLFDRVGDGTGRWGVR